MAQFVFDVNKLMRDIKKATGEEAEKAMRRVTVTEKREIGEAVIDEMKIAIAKGISPIKGAGRFPAYGGTKKQGRPKEDLYPKTVQKKFPEKRPRPVNLVLSGQFLNNLKAKVLGSVLYIGFFEDPWMKYEEGHRKGSNNQEKRPIIPTTEEELSQSVYRRLVKALQEVFDRQK
jgi:hypothetical protein